MVAERTNEVWGNAAGSASLRPNRLYSLFNVRPRWDILILVPVATSVWRLFSQICEG